MHDSYTGRNLSKVADGTLDFNEFVDGSIDAGDADGEIRSGGVREAVLAYILLFSISGIEASVERAEYLIGVLSAREFALSL